MNRLYKLVALFFLFSVALPSYALKMKPVTFQQLIAQSSVIALVEIEKLQSIKADNFTCGFEYKAKLLNVHKGENRGSISFGYMEGLKTGKQYLVFLQTNNAVIFTSANFQKQFSNKKMLTECKNHQLAKYTLAQAGMAYFEVQSTPLFDFKANIKLKPQYFKITDNVKSVKDKNYPNIIWLKLDDVLSLIK